jgi:hypothetical protein
MSSLHKWLSTGLFQPFGNPLVQAFTLLQSGYIYLAVQSSRQAKHEPPGERFIRLFTSFQTKFQIVVDGFPKGLFQFFNTYELYHILSTAKQICQSELI